MDNEGAAFDGVTARVRIIRPIRGWDARRRRCARCSGGWLWTVHGPSFTDTVFRSVKVGILLSRLPMPKSPGKYVDGFVITMPKNVDAYRKMAAKGKALAQGYGALDYKECVIGDVKPRASSCRSASS